MVVGGYTLDLYCDNKKEHKGGWYNNTIRFPIEFTADGKKCYSIVRRISREAGWTLHVDNTATCPICNSKLKVKPKHY